MTRLRAILLAGLVLATAIAVAQLLPPFSARTPLPVLETLGGDFALPSTLGGETHLADFRGQLVLLNFGYTTCPSVCPTVLLRMRQALLGLGRDASQVQPMFITIDPERDTLDALRPYTHYFHPSFVAMRGSPVATREVAQLFKVYFEKEPVTVTKQYGFIHSDPIYLIDRHGRVRATFSNTALPQQMIADMRSLIHE